MTNPTLLHKYDIADFTNNTYWMLYFQGIGVFEINGETIVGFPGLKLTVKVETRPIHISGGDELYLFGETPSCANYLTYQGTENNELQGATTYYYGNFGQGAPDFSFSNCGVVSDYWLTEDGFELTDELGYPFYL